VSIPTVSDTKQAFQRSFPKPINSVYRRAIDELLVETHLLTVSQTFKYDPVFALGWVTAFDGFTMGYQPDRDRPQIYHALATALRFDPDQLRSTALHLEQLATERGESVAKLLTTLEADTNLDPLTDTLRIIADNGQFKYSRLFGVGLFRLLELSAPQEFKETESRKELLSKLGTTLNIASDKLIRDQELYQSSLEKLRQGLQMMADLVEAERKKRQKVAPTPTK
jgi:photosystem II biogenesis protein Psp29